MKDEKQKIKPLSEFGDTLIEGVQSIGYNVLVRAEYSIKIMALRDEASLAKEAEAGNVPTTYYIVSRGKHVDNINLGQRFIPADRVMKKVGIPSNKRTAKHLMKLFSPGELDQDEYKKMLIDKKRNIVVAVDYFIEDCNYVVGALFDEYVDLDNPKVVREDD